MKPVCAPLCSWRNIEKLVRTGIKRVYRCKKCGNKFNITDDGIGKPYVTIMGNK